MRGGSPGGGVPPALPPAWAAWLAPAVASYHGRKLLRSLRPITPTGSAVRVRVPPSTLREWLGDEVTSGTERACGGEEEEEEEGGEELVLFSGNDYLGLSAHPAVRAAAAAAAEGCGMGPRASALVAGYTRAHRDLEAELAGLKGTEDCLLFPTGFAANMAAISALAEAGGGGGGGVAIFSDELNHASIVDGMRLARRKGGGGAGAEGGVEVHVYRHNDLTHLEELLTGCGIGRKMVVTDSLFSMDGDFADLRGLARLRRRHGFLLVIDEAHATLVCGEHGGGYAEEAGVAGEVDVHVGTLSKAVGCLGGFVACSREMKLWLLNRGRAGVYSTALPQPVVAGALASIRAARDEPWRRERVWAHVRRLSRATGRQVDSPIASIIVGDEGEALAISKRLLRQGFHVPAIRPPTVPRGTARLRVTLSAAHSEDDVERMCEALGACGLPPPAAAAATAAGGAGGAPRARL